MSLEKVTVEIERWFSSSSTNTTDCYLRFFLSRLPILLNPKPHSSHFETVHIQILSSTCILKEISKIKNIEKKVASVNEKKNFTYKKT